MKLWRSAHGHWRGVLPFAVTIGCLVVTIVAGYRTQLSLVESSRWVTHTVEVKLAIADCELALLRGDADALRRTEAKVERLTVDNPRQQRNVVLAYTRRSSQAELENLFTSMQGEEDRLMTVRMRTATSIGKRSAIAFVAGAVLTLACGAGTVALLYSQRRSLALAHAELARQRVLLAAIIESVDEGIIAVETSRKMIAINAAARSMVGVTFPLDHVPEDWRPNLRATFEDGSPMSPEEAPLTRALRGEACEDVVYRILPGAEPRADDAGVWVSTSARPILDQGGRVLGAVATLRDITAQRATAERLRDLSLRDELTGLLNRRGFLAAASVRIAEAQRVKGPLGLLYADVNGLKRINDDLGHEQGDRVIEDAARMLRGVLREGDVLARLGGDEFVALLQNFSLAAREPLLERIATAIRHHVEGEVRPYRLSVSVGVTIMDWESGQTLDELLATADRCMYERKRSEQSSPMIHALPVD